MMLDARLRRLIDPPLDAMAARLVGSGITADQVTIAGFLVGIAGAAALALSHPLVGAALIAVNRLADGLDGAVARRTVKTDRGGFLDIALDLAFYAAVPLAFAVADPTGNALAAATLLAAFLVNAAAFLAFAVMAERRRMVTTAQGEKSLYYLAGLAEGGETIAVFMAMCLFPAAFPGLAYAFAALCAVSGGARIGLGWRKLADAAPPQHE
jgi:phosphatidylglycerophosphate synthase